MDWLKIERLFILFLFKDTTLLTLPDALYYKRDTEHQWLLHELIEVQ